MSAFNAPRTYCRPAATAKLRAPTKKTLQTGSANQNIQPCPIQPSDRGSNAIIALIVACKCLISHRNS